MRLVVTGGGSGGHVYPALAIADKFKEMDPEGEILYIGYKNGFEKNAVPKAGYRLEEIDTRWVSRSNAKEIFSTAYHVVKGIEQSRRILKKFKPDLVIGTGGYVCFPVIFSGHRLGIPCYIHEQNAFPGLANRKLEKYVRKIFLGFKEGGDYFSSKDKLVVTGNPVRSSFFKADKMEARKKLGIGENDFVVFSFGGSLGAEPINRLAMSLVEDMNGKEDQRLVFGTGRRFYDQVMAELDSRGIVPEGNIKIQNYIDDMDNVIAASDLIISRAGALSVAEILVTGRPSVLIPSPNVTGNHQYFNAKAVADEGGAILIEEKDIDEDKFRKIVNELRNDPERLKTMGQKAHELAARSASDIIYEEIDRDLWKTTNA